MINSFFQFQFVNSDVISTIACNILYAAPVAYLNNGKSQTL